MTQYHGMPELLFGVGTFILGVVTAWAMLRNKYRNRANDAVTEAATREEYRHPGNYDPEKFRQELGLKNWIKLSLLSLLRAYESIQAAITLGYTE